MATDLGNDGLQEETFPGTPQPLTPAQSAQVPQQVQRLLDVFVDRGFAIKVPLLLPPPGPPPPRPPPPPPAAPPPAAPPAPHAGREGRVCVGRKGVGWGGLGGLGWAGVGWGGLGGEK